MNSKFKRGMLPPFSKYKLEVLKSLSRREGAGVFISTLYDEIANNLDLSLEQRKILVNSQVEPRFECYIRSACSALAKKRYVMKEKVKGQRGAKWFITNEGKKHFKSV
ncbi:winged helix-turn-helix domain-containing protein [Bacillus paralicheniformis]|uniref:winged helix-turn-helix domain-containing protein n=1 Tax=Bacillus paralicheniformis TaxID=1648923 RepID=UPI0034D2C4E6